MRISLSGCTKINHHISFTGTDTQFACIFPCSYSIFYIPPYWFFDFRNELMPDEFLAMKQPRLETLEQSSVGLYDNLGFEEMDDVYHLSHEELVIKYFFSNERFSSSF